MTTKSEQMRSISQPLKNNLLLRRNSVPVAASVIVFAIGLLTLAGWIFEIDFLKRIIPGYVFMNPTTSIAFIVSSVTLMLIQKKDARLSVFVQVCAGILTLVGLAKLCAIVGVFDIGIDRILFQDNLFDSVTGEPNRMAPNTALNFFLLGLAIFLLDKNSKAKSNFYLSQYLSIAVLLTAMLAIIGYAYGAKSFYVFVTYNPMAIHTAVSFFLMSIGLLLSRTDQGLMKHVFSPTMGGEMARRLFPVVIIIPAVLGWLRLKGGELDLFGIQMGTALHVVTISVILGAIILNNARLMNSAAAKRRQTEEDLEKSNERFQLVTSATNDAIWDWNLTTNKLWWNNEFQKSFGYSTDKNGFGIDSWTERLHPDDFERVNHVIHALIDSGKKNWAEEYRFRRRDGSYAYVSDRGYVVYDDQGKTVRMLGSMMDVSARKQAEDDLGKSERRYRNLTEKSLGLICTHDLEGRILSVNPAGANALGYESEEIVGKLLSDLVAPKTKLLFADYLEKIITEGEASGLMIILTKSGEERTWQYNNTLSREEDNSFVLGYAQDITEYRRAESALKDSRQLFQQFMDNSPAMKSMKDADGKYIFINAPMEKMFNIKLEDLRGQTDSYFLPPEIAEKVRISDLLVTEKGRTFETVEEMLMPNGERYYWQSFKFPVIDGSGQRFVGGITFDITERRRIEESLIQSELKFRSVTQSANDAIVAADGKGNIISWNNGAERIFGYDESEVLGKSLTLLMPEVYHEAHRAGMERHQATGETHVIGKTVELTGLRKDETEFPLELSLTSWMTGEERFYSGIIRDITERKRAEKALEEAVRRESAMIENALDVICSFDVDGKFTTVNPACFNILGFQPEELIGRKYIELVAPQDVEKTNEAAARIMAGEALSNFENCYQHKNGTFVHIMWAAFWSESEQLMFCVARDISERKQIESDLEVARDAALESARLKSEFLANMSHEIRTPMNGVIGMTGLLLNTNLSAQQNGYADVIQASADDLLRIIDDILDFSKIEAGQLRFEKMDFELRETVESTVEILAEKAQTKGLELAAFVHPDVPAFVRTDTGRLRQILTNLLGNAVKFTEKGEVIVNVTKESETEKHFVLRFEIKDTGIGISKQSQRRLFQAFVQADGSTTRKYGGTGLGLAISKQLVEMMGGDIGVESEYGKGSTFWFTARLEKPAQSFSVPDSINTSLEGVRVLIVDDNATNRTIFHHQTSSWGMIPTEADSGERALELMREAAADRPYEIVILDLMMPEMDGFELARRIKTDPSISSASLVLLPSYGKLGHGEQALEFGIAAYLQKPVRESHLYSCLMKVMVEKPLSPIDESLSRLITHYSLGKHVKHIEIPKSKTAKAQILVAEDNLVNQEVALSQLQSLGYQADVVNNGLEAVEALQNHAYDVVLMDCQMPEMDGFEATAEIRWHEGDAKHTVIIAMTAHALEGDRQKCLAAGMDDYISKPVKIATLSQTLERWLADSPAEKISEQPEKEIISSDEPKLQSMDFSILDGFREFQQPGAPDLVEKLVNLFITDTSEHLLMLRAALTENDSSTVKKEAHSIKGSAGNIGAGRLAGLCKELEKQVEDNISAEKVFSQMEKEFTIVRQALESMPVSAA
jgi:PAS domain S-box-containing protein